MYRYVKIYMSVYVCAYVYECDDRKTIKKKSKKYRWTSCSSDSAMFVVAPFSSLFFSRCYWKFSLQWEEGNARGRPPPTLCTTTSS